MCIFRVKEEEEIPVPYRTTRVTRVRSQSPRRRSSHRVSRTEIIRESRPEVIRESRPTASVSSYTVPAPKSLTLPPPQPAPVFVEPAPEPPRHAAPSHHYVEVSPRSSATSYSRSPSRSEYVVHERETMRERRRDYSPESSPRYESFRYVDPPPEERYERYARRERSRSRDSRGRGYGYDDPRGSYRETRERIVISDGDGRRRREYHR